MHQHPSGLSVVGICDALLYDKSLPVSSLLAPFFLLYFLSVGYYKHLVGLEHTMYPRLASSFYLFLLGIRKGMSHHTNPSVVISLKLNTALASGPAVTFTRLTGNFISIQKFKATL